MVGHVLISDRWAHGIPVYSTSLPHPRDSIRNCALSMDQIPDLHSPLSPISESPGSPAYSTGKLQRGWAEALLSLVGNVCYLCFCLCAGSSALRNVLEKPVAELLVLMHKQLSVQQPWIMFPWVPGNGHKVGSQCEC